MNEQYRALIASDRVSPQTRSALEQRGAADDPDYQPVALTPEQFNALRALADRIIPQDAADGGLRIDLAARLDRQLEEQVGDGWRYASLPDDRSAYRAGLSLLNEHAREQKAVGFDCLAEAAQNALLEAISAGTFKSERLDLQRWFEDLRADLTKIYVAHPETLARMNYSGIADDSHGFVQVGIGKVEDWEPHAR